MVDPYRLHNLGALNGSTMEMWHSMANVGNAVDTLRYPALKTKFDNLLASYRAFAEGLKEVTKTELEAAQK